MITYKCKIYIENINQSKIPIEEAESGDCRTCIKKVFELPFDEVVGVQDCLAGKAGSGNGGKAGTAGMSLVFAFFSSKLPLRNNRGIPFYVRIFIFTQL